MCIVKTDRNCSEEILSLPIKLFEINYINGVVINPTIEPIMNSRRFFGNTILSSILKLE